MNCLTSHILQSAEQLLQEKKFKEVLTKLGEIEVISISPQELALRNLLFAEANLSLSRYNIQNEIEQAVSYFKAGSDNEKFGKAKHLQGWQMISMGRYFEAREMLLESFTAYKRCDKPFAQGRVLNRLALVSFRLGDIEGAVNYMGKCISVYQTNGDIKRTLTVKINLAHLHFSAGRISEAIKLHKEIESGVSVWSRNNTAIYFIQSAIPHALRGDFIRAKELIQDALPFLEDGSREQAIYYENLGWIHLLEGDYIHAEKALHNGLELSLAIAPESALVSQIRRRLADVSIGQGSFQTAIQHAKEALAVAEKINERIEMAACFRALARIELHHGNSETARRYFKQSFDLFSMIGSCYELAVTRYLAAASGLYPDGQRQALFYLAREYFDGEQITHYLTTIDSELERTAGTTGRPARVDGRPPEIIGRNRKLQKLTALARNVAASEMSVLLTGPTGTGKDLFAHYIHHFSGRRGRFVSVNTAAIPAGMIEAELFGYRKGAFTGADRHKQGLIEEADQGTLYLNEIADSSPDFQAKLLDVLEHRAIRRLGETRERKIAFRLIAATNNDLEAHVRGGRFRADLYHRLNDIHIDLPPLCARLDDIPDLLACFLAQINIEIDTDDHLFKKLTAVLASRDWPGNIRQFKSDVERLALLSEGDLSRMISAVPQYRQSERDELLSLLNQNNWNRREVARILGLSEGGIRYRIRKYRLTEKSTA